MITTNITAVATTNTTTTTATATPVAVSSVLSLFLLSLSKTLRTYHFANQYTTAPIREPRKKIPPSTSFNTETKEYKEYQNSDPLPSPPNKPLNDESLDQQEQQKQQEKQQQNGKEIPEGSVELSEMPSSPMLCSVQDQSTDNCEKHISRKHNTDHSRFNSNYNYNFNNTYDYHDYQNYRLKMAKALNGRTDEDDDNSTLNPTVYYQLDNFSASQPATATAAAEALSSSFPSCRLSKTRSRDMNRTSIFSYGSLSSSQNLRRRSYPLQRSEYLEIFNSDIMNQQSMFQEVEMKSVISF